MRKLLPFISLLAVLLFQAPLYSGGGSSVGQLDEDLFVERVTVAPDGKLYAWDKEGRIKPGWPKNLIGEGRFFSFKPRLFDVDYDLQEEVAAVTQALEGDDLFFHLFKGDGRELIRWRFPRSDLVETPLIADVNHDSLPDVVFTTTSRHVYVYRIFEGEFQILKDWSFDNVPFILAGDPDNNGLEDLFILDGGEIKKWDPMQPEDEGLSLFAVLGRAGETALTPVAFTDLNDDLYPDLVYATSAGRIAAVDREGRRVAGFNLPEGRRIASGVAIEDIDLDRRPEILVLTETEEILAFEANGTPVANWRMPLWYRHPLPDAGIAANDAYAGLFSTATGWDQYTVYRDKLGGYSRILLGENVHEWDSEAAFHFVEPVEITDVFALPQLFTPNGDGVNDQVVVHYRLSEEALVSLEIYDAHERFISSVFSRQAKGAGEQGDTFNGRDMKGTLNRKDDRPLATGTYIIKVMAQSADGMVSSAKTVVIVNGIKAEIEQPVEEANVFGRISIQGVALDPNAGENNQNADFASYKLYYRPGRWEVSPEEAVAVGLQGSGWLPLEVPVVHQCPDNARNEPGDAVYPHSNVSCRPVQHGVLGTFDAGDGAVTPNGEYTLLLKTLDSNGNQPDRISYDTAVVNVRNPLDPNAGLFNPDDLFNPLNPQNPVYRGPAITNAGVNPAFIDPENPRTTIRYTLQNETANIHLDIFSLVGDQLGPAAAAYVFNRQAPGDYQFDWNGTNTLGRNVDGGNYRIRLTAYAVDGTGVAIDESQTVTVARGFSVRDHLAIQNFSATLESFAPFDFGPDLAREITTLQFALTREAQVTIQVFDQAPEAGGQALKTLLNGVLRRAGDVVWDGTGDNGVILDAGRSYLVRLTAESVEIGRQESVHQDLQIALEQMEVAEGLEASLDRLVGDAGLQEDFGDDGILHAMQGSPDFIWRVRGEGYVEMPFDYEISAYGVEEREEREIDPENPPAEGDLVACYNGNNSPPLDAWDEMCMNARNNGNNGFAVRNISVKATYNLDNFLVRAADARAHLYQGDVQDTLGENESRLFPRASAFHDGNNTVRFSFYHPVTNVWDPSCTDTGVVCPRICINRAGKIFDCNADGNYTRDNDVCTIRNRGVPIPAKLYNCGKIELTVNSSTFLPNQSWPDDVQNRDLWTTKGNATQYSTDNPNKSDNLARYQGRIGSGQGRNAEITGYNLYIRNAVNGIPGDHQIKGSSVEKKLKLYGLEAWVEGDGTLEARVLGNDGAALETFNTDANDPYTLLNSPYGARKIWGWHRGFNRDRFQPRTDPISIYRDGFAPNLFDGNPGSTIYTFSDIVHITNWEVELRYPNVSVDNQLGDNPGALNIFELEGPVVTAPGVRGNQNSNIEDTFRLKLLPEAQPKRFVEIHGSAAANYELFYYDASQDNAGWYRIPPRMHNAVENGLLAHWDVTRLNGENYTLVLRAVDPGNPNRVHQDTFRVGIGTRVDLSNLGEGEFARVDSTFKRASLLFGPDSLNGPELVTINVVPRNEADFRLPNGIAPRGPIFDIQPDDIQIDPRHPIQLELTFTPAEIQELFGVESASELQIYNLAGDDYLEGLVTVILFDTHDDNDPANDVYRFTAYLEHFSQYLLGRRQIGEFHITSPRFDQTLRGIVPIEGRLEKDGEPAAVADLRIEYVSRDAGGEEAEPVLIFEGNESVFNTNWDVTGLGGNYLLIFTAVNAQNEAGRFELPVAVDNTPSVSTLLVDGMAVLPGAEMRVGPGAVIEIRAEDPLGVARIEFAWDGAPLREYLQPMAVPFADGTHVLNYRAMDNNGNAEGPKIATLTVEEDRAPEEGMGNLEVMLELEGPQWLQNTNQTWVTPQTAFALQPNNDAVQGIRYRAGHPFYQEYASPFHLEGGEGIYQVEFYGWNPQGFRGAVQTKQVFLDATPPQTELTMEGRHLEAGDAHFVTPKTELRLTAREEGVQPVGLLRTEFRADDGPWQMYAGPLRVEDVCRLAFLRPVIGGGGGGPAPGPDPGPPQPSCLFAWRSLDRLGNAEIEKSVELRVDETAPELAFQDLNRLFFISPNGDGKHDTLDFPFLATDNFYEKIYTSFKLHWGADNVTVVWNRQLLGHSGEVSHLTWDGRINGELLRETLYTMEIQAFDEQGNYSRSYFSQLHYDLTPPRVHLADVNVLSFSPNGDAVSDILQINYDLIEVPGVSNVQTELHVETEAGFTIKVAEDLFRAGFNNRRQFSWDGTNLADNPAFDGTYRFYIVAEDEAGNRSEPVAGEAGEAVGEIFIDRVPPRTTLRMEGPRYVANNVTWLGPASRVGLESADPAPGAGVREIQYTLGDADFVPYAQPFTVPMPDVDYVLRFFGIDAVGNREQENSVTLRLDATPPRVEALVGEPKMGKGDDTWVGPQTPIAFEGEDINGVGFRTVHYELPGGQPQVFEEPFTLAGLPDGGNTIAFWGEDLVDNAGQRQSLLLHLDQTAPVTRLVVGDPKFEEEEVTYVTSKTVLTFEAVAERGDLERTEYRLDEGQWLLAGPVQLQEEGKHLLSWRSSDLLGNVEEEKARVLVVDNTAPEPLLALNQGNGGVYLTGQTLISLGGDTKGAGVETIFYQIDGGPWQVYNGPFSIAHLGPGPHVITYYSRDRLGNLSAKKEFVAQLMEVLVERTDFAMPRVLVFWMGKEQMPDGAPNANARFLEELLEEMGGYSRVTDTAEDFAAQMRLDKFTTYVFVTDAPVLQLPDTKDFRRILGELKSRIDKGESLVSLLGFARVESNDWRDFRFAWGAGDPGVLSALNVVPELKQSAGSFVYGDGKIVEFTANVGLFARGDNAAPARAGVAGVIEAIRPRGEILSPGEIFDTRLTFTNQGDLPVQLEVEEIFPQGGRIETPDTGQEVALDRRHFALELPAQGTTFVDYLYRFPLAEGEQHIIAAVQALWEGKIRDQVTLDVAYLVEPEPVEEEAGAEAPLEEAPQLPVEPIPAGAGKALSQAAVPQAAVPQAGAAQAGGMEARLDKLLAVIASTPRNFREKHLKMDEAVEGVELTEVKKELRLLGNELPSFIRRGEGEVDSPAVDAPKADTPPAQEPPADAPPGDVPPGDPHQPSAFTPGGGGSKGGCQMNPTENGKEGLIVWLLIAGFLVLLRALKRWAGLGVIFLIAFLVVGWSGRANAQVVSTPISNNGGVQVYTPYEFFSKGEGINLSSGTFVIQSHGLQIPLKGSGYLELNNSYNTVDSDFTFEEFRDVFPGVVAHAPVNANQNGYWRSVRPNVDRLVYENSIIPLGILGKLHSESRETEDGSVKNKVFLEVGYNGSLISWSEYVGIIVLMQVNPNRPERHVYLLAVHKDGAVEPFNFFTGESFWKKTGSRVVQVPGESPQNLEDLATVTLRNEQGTDYLFQKVHFGQVGHHAEYSYSCDSFWIFEKTCHAVSPQLENWQVATYFLKNVNAVGWHEIDADVLQISDQQQTQTISADNGATIMRQVLEDGSESWTTHWLEGRRREWRVSFDDRRRITSIEDPEHNRTTYAYTLETGVQCNGCPPLKRELGWDNLVTPDYFVQINYPTGGVIRYEWFGSPAEEELSNRHIIVTEFPDRTNSEIAYQKYYSVRLENREGQPLQIFTDVYSSNGSVSQFQFEKRQGRMLLMRETTQGDNQTLVKTYEWSEHADGQINGIQRMRMIVNGSPEFSAYSAGYDDKGRVVSQTDSAGNTSSLQYLGDTDLPTRITTGDLIYIYGYGGNDYCERSLRSRWLSNIARKLNDSDQTVQSFCYDDYGNVVKAFRGLPSDEESNFSVNYADAAVPVGAEQNRYDLATGVLLSKTNIYGVQTQYRYNQIGSLTDIAFPGGAFIHNLYEVRNGDPEKKNRVVTTIHDNTTQRDITTERVFNGMDQLVELRRGDQVTRYDYTPDKRLRSLHYPDGRVESFEYDAFGRITRKSMTGLASQRFEYAIQVENDLPLQVTTVKVNDHPVQRFAHDLTGRLRRVERLNGEQVLSATAYQYDAAGNLSRIVTPSSMEIVKAVNYREGVTTQTFPGGDVLKIADSSGTGAPDRIESNGVEAELRYSANRLLEGIQYPNGQGNLTITHGNPLAAENTFNRMATVEDSFGETSFQYSPQGVAEVIERRLDDFQNRPYKFYQVKDGFGNLVRLIYPNGLSVYYKRDGQERVTEVRKDSESGLLLAAVEYAPNGQPSRITYANGVQTSYDYDSAGRVQNITTRKGEKYLLDDVYSYDERGRKASVTHLDGSHVEYGYDGLNQLIQANYFRNGEDQPYDTQNYSYDLEGNRTGSSILGEPDGEGVRVARKEIQYDVNNDSGRVVGYHVKVGQRETLQGVLEYGRGNVTRLTETQKGRESLAKTLVFNDKNQLTSVTVNDAKNRFNANTRYAYDYAGRREMAQTDGKKTYYLYGEALDPLMELNGEGEIQTFHVYIGSRRLATISGDDLDFYHSDELDNVLKVTNEKGEEVQSVRYDPFGNINFLAGSSSNNHLFAGKPYDQSSGLVYFGARYYDPQLGRFLSRDPLLQGTNHYIYAQNNPVNDKDVFGLFFKKLWKFIKSMVKQIVAAGVGVNSSLGEGQSFTRGEFWARGNDFKLSVSAPLSQNSGPVMTSLNVGPALFTGTFSQDATPRFSVNAVFDDESSNGGSSAFNAEPGVGIAFGSGPVALRRGDLNILNYQPSSRPRTAETPLSGALSFPQLQDSLNFDPLSQLTPSIQNGMAGGEDLFSVNMVLDPPNNEVNFGGTGSVDSHREEGDQQDVGGDGGAENGNVQSVNPRLPQKFSPVNPVTAGGFTERPEDKPASSVQATGGNPPAPGAVAVAGMPNTTDPILLHSGDLLQTETDLKIPGRGIDFEFTRTYRSRVVYDGPLGWGWDHNYNKRLVEQEGGNIARLDGNARFDIYVKNGDGSYVSPSGYFDTLTVVREEAEPHRMISAAIRDKFGTTYSYAADGWITQITDRNGNTLTFGYEEVHNPLLCKEGAGEVDHCRRLKTVTDTLGRNITFGYEGRRITTLTDFTGRAVRFAYDDHGDLISVTDPADNVTRYAYDSGYLDDRAELNHNLRTVTDAKGQIYLRNEYSIYDRVVVQQFGDEGKFRMEYHQVASSLECTPNLFGNIFYRTRVRDRVGNLVDYTFNCQGNPLEVIRHTRGLRQGDPARYVTRYRYNAQGLLDRLEQPRGNVVEYGYDPTTGNMLAMRRLPAPGAQGAGVLTTTYEYDPNFSRLLSVTDPENHTTTFTLDDRGNITQKCLPPLDPPPPPAGGGQGEVICETYQYNTFGQILSVTDGEGNADTYAYDDVTGYLNQIIRGEGSTNLTNEFIRDERGNITSFTDGRGNVFNFEVDLLNQVTHESGPENYERRFAYDENKNLIRIEGASSPTTTFTYNILDRVVTKEETISDNHTALTEYQYDLNENLTRIVDPEGNSTFIEYDERDLPWRVTKGYRTPEASTQTFTFDANGNVESLRDGNGNTVSYQYDPHDRLLKVIDPLNNEMELGYDNVGNVTAMIRRGNANPPPPVGGGQGEGVLAHTEFIYDNLNRLIEKIERNDPADSVTRYQYNRAHQLTQLTDAKNHVTEFVYDAADRLVEKTDAGRFAVQYCYDGNGNLVREFQDEESGRNAFPECNVEANPDQNQFVSTFEYDALNRPASRTDNAGNVTAYDYDVRGNLTATTDAEGNVVSYCYDGLNRLTEEVKGLQAVAACGGDDGIRTQYEHNDNGRITQVTDANRHETHFTYDALGRQVGVELANGAAYAKRYDANGNLIEEAQPNGYRVESRYDAANRLIRKVITKPNAQAPLPPEEEIFTYDGLSRMLTANNAQGSVTFAYDKLSQLISETQTLAGQNAHTISKAYDPVGNIEQKIYPSGRILAYSHDSLNRLTGISETIEGIFFDDSLPILKEKNYLGVDRVKDQKFGNNQQEQFLYDPLKRINNIIAGMQDADGVIRGDNIINNFAYGYDKIGNRTSERREHGQNVLTNEFGYDSIYRLVSSLATVTEGAGQRFIRDQWDLDPVDNWELRIRGLTPQSDANDRAQEFGVNEVNAYTNIDGQAFVYDTNGNLIEDGTNRYEYNYRNLLTKVVRKGAGGVADEEVAAYGYDALGRRVLKTVVNPADGNRAMTNHIYDGVQVVEELAGDGSTAREFIYGDSIDDPVAMSAAAEYHYYHTDAQGSVVALTNPAGEVEERYSYDAYGDPQITDAATGAVLDRSEAGNPFLYTGQFFDNETGFYYYKARYYHPTLGRFLQRDPLGYIDGYNLYAYVNNNPLNWVDPLGFGKERQQNSWIGRVTGNPIEGAADLQTGNEWIDPTLGLVNDAVNAVNNAGWAVLQGVGGAVRAGEEFFGVTTDELFWSSQSTPIPLDDAASAALVGLSRVGRVESAAVKSTETLPSKLYHYTRAENVENILQKGLGYDRPLTWTTPNGGLSPVQAQIELALPPNRGYPSALFEIDTARLQQLGINPAVGPQRIMSTANASGGGVEMIFNQPIPPSAIQQVPFP